MITESNLKTKLRTENTAWFLIRQWVRLFLACFIAVFGSYQQMMSAICRLGQWFWGEILKAYILKGRKGVRNRSRLRDVFYEWALFSLKPVRTKGLVKHLKIHQNYKTCFFLCVNVNGSSSLFCSILIL